MIWFRIYFKTKGPLRERKQNVSEQGKRGTQQELIKVRNEFFFATTQEK